MSKICCTCKNEKDISFFCANKNTEDKLSAQCKECAKEYRDLNKEKKKNYPSSTREYRDNYTKNNIEHINELCRIRYAADPDRFKEQNKNNYEKHKPKRRKSQSDSYFENLEYHQTRGKVYRANNKESINLSNRARQKKLANYIKITQKEINELLNDHNNKCFYCEIDVVSGINLHLDHKIPLSRGGEHIIENLVPACKVCNLRKGTKTPEEFYEYLKLFNKRVA